MGFLLPAVIVVVLDQFTKQLFWRSFDPGRSTNVIDGIFRITLVKNTGAAFGVFEGGRPFFIAASVVAAVLLLYVGLRLPASDRYKRTLLGLILGGAVGNLIDRVYSGEVIDFLEIGIAGHWWPVFNVADVAVSVGVVLLLIYLVRSSREPHVADSSPENGNGAVDAAPDGSTRP